MRHVAQHVLIGLIVGATMAALDLTLFRFVLPTDVYDMVSHRSALERFIAIAPRAILDELLFRLVGVTWLARFLQKFFPVRVAWPGAILIVATAYLPLHPAYLASLGQPSPVIISRELIEHVGSGALWGWLFWKRGLLASMTSHVCAHLPLQLGWSLLA